MEISHGNALRNIALLVLGAKPKGYANVARVASSSCAATSGLRDQGGGRESCEVFVADVLWGGLETTKPAQGGFCLNS